MRPDFHAVLLEQLKAIGIYLEYGKEVVDYFENAQGGQAGVVLEDGSKHSTDLVIAADGVRSPSWGLVAGQPVANRSSGNAIFRVAYPVEHALTDPMIAEHFQLTEDGRSVMEMWAGPGAYAMFWRNKDFMTWALNNPVSDRAFAVIVVIIRGLVLTWSRTTVQQKNHGATT